MAHPLQLQDLSPRWSGDVFYQILAPGTANSQGEIKVTLVLVMRNSHPTQSIEPRRAEFRFFSGFENIASESRDLKGIVLAPKQTKRWFWGKPERGRSTFFLTSPPTPDTVEVAVRCEGYSDPVAERFDIRDWGGGSVRFPFDEGDLLDGEYYVAKNDHSHSHTEQISALDIYVEGYSAGSAVLSKLSSPTASSNADHRIWDRPVRAIADGTVHSYQSGEPDDPLGSLGGAPNFVRLCHGPGRVARYSHLKKDSVPLQVRNAAGTSVVIRAGEVIGQVGNSGQSPEPHLHIEYVGYSPFHFWPLLFHDIVIVDCGQPGKIDGQTQWVKVNGVGLPREKVAIRPRNQPPIRLPVSWDQRRQLSRGTQLGG